MLRLFLANRTLMVRLLQDLYQERWFLLDSRVRGNDGGGILHFLPQPKPQIDCHEADQQAAKSIGQGRQIAMFVKHL